MRKRRVLIFDDEPMILSMLEDLFLDLGYEVYSFSEQKVCPISNNNTATCEYANPCADVIIADIEMPRMSGIDLLYNQNLRGCKLRMRNKAIISGYNKEAYIDKINELGCKFIQKPFDYPDLITWVEDCEHRTNLSQPLSPIR